MEAEDRIDDCAACLQRDVIVCEAQAEEHDRCILTAKEALSALRTSRQLSHDDVAASIHRAQIHFMLNRNHTLATTDDGSVCSARPALDLSSLQLN